MSGVNIKCCYCKNDLYNNVDGVKSLVCIDIEPCYPKHTPVFNTNHYEYDINDYLRYKVYCEKCHNVKKIIQ